MILLDIQLLKCLGGTLLQPMNMQRVTQLGENPKRVHNVGAMGVDKITKTLLSN